MGNPTSLRLLILLLFAAILPLVHSYDPCGPLRQEVGNPNNTCDQNITQVAAPSAYGAFLNNDGTGRTILWENCVTVVYDACAALTNPSTPAGQWNWTDPGSDCVMGFWLPQYNGSAPVPKYDVCFDNVYLQMAAIGALAGGNAYNQVSVNIKLMPNDYQTGEAVNVGYPSYTITVLPLQRSAQTPLLAKGRG